MNISVCVGTWLLIGSLSIKSELEFGVKNWLNNKMSVL